MSQQSRWMWTEITHTRCHPLSQKSDAFDFAHLFHDKSAYYLLLHTCYYGFGPLKSHQYMLDEADIGARLQIAYTFA